MSRSLMRYGAVLGLLLLGGAAALAALTRPAPTAPAPTPAPASAPPATRRAATPAPLDFVFIQDVDGWRRTPDEAAVTTPYDLRVGPAIESLPLALGDWTGVDEAADREFVMSYLQPDYWVYRRYERAAGRDVVWLSLIASRDARSFHPPEVCYQAQGWAVGGRRLEPVPIGQGRIQAQRVIAAQDGVTHGVLYWYLWMNPQREVAQGCVMVKLTVLMADGQDWGAALAPAKALAAALFSDVLPWHRY